MTIPLYVLVVLQSCNTFYATAYPITTAHERKNEFAGTGTVGAGGLNAYVSYTPSKFFFIGGNFHAYQYAGQKSLVGGPHAGLYYNGLDSSFHCSITGGVSWGESDAGTIRVTGRSSFNSYFFQILMSERVGKKKLGRLGGGIYVDNKIDLHYSNMYYPSSNGPDSLAEKFTAAGIFLFHQRQFQRCPQLRLTSQLALQGIFPEKGATEEWTVFQPLIFRIGLTYQFPPFSKRRN